MLSMNDKEGFHDRKKHLCTLQAIIQLPLTGETEQNETRAPPTGRKVAGYSSCENF